MSSKTKKTSPAGTECLYQAEELAKAAGKLFGVSQEGAAAALKAAGIKMASQEEAGKIIHTFMKKEVI